jgi:hypothetical protein
MITRKNGFPRLFSVRPMVQDNHAGLIHTKIVNGVPHVWPVARPRGTHMPEGAPHYTNTPSVNHELNSNLIRFNSPQLRLTRPNNMMDPSEPKTWQRTYLFS